MSATVGKKASKWDFSGAIDESIHPKKSTVQKDDGKEEMAKLKGKGGRPSNGDVKKISLAIPVELMEGVETGATLFFKGNKTAYINALIKKDLQENGEKYREFQEMQQGR